jgi:hypothetical protein
LGLLSPVVVAAKIFIQRLWKLRIDWDDELSDTLHKEWMDFRSKLNKLHELKIGRHVHQGTQTIKRRELHIFSDASEKAFGAVAYIRTINNDGVITCRMLCSKSKVAPLKIVTLPRLELCAARLAVKLMTKVEIALKTPFDETYLWSDSQITLSWIKGDAGNFKTFVAYRVTYIQKRSKLCNGVM